MTTDAWHPEDEAAIEAAVREGLISESHFFDAKREIEQSAAARKELARDLVSFAIDGGSLLIGLEEDKIQRTWNLAPQPLAGQAERVEMIAKTLSDPPLFVVTHELPSQQDPSKGYLLVTIPASPVAPHMVAGIYYGRGHVTRNRLSDSEVRRLHAMQRGSEEKVDELIDSEIGRDPTRSSGRRNGHLFVVAQPVNGSKHLARSFVRGHRQGIDEVVNQAESTLGALTGLPPTPSYASSYASRSAGVALCSPTLENGRLLASVDDDERIEANAVDIEFREDGGIRIFVGRMTWSRPNSWGARPPTKIINDGVAVAYALRIVHMARLVSLRTGYMGSWDFGLAADALSGGISMVFSTGVSFNTPAAFDEASYREATRATFVELSERPREVAERLVGALVRALGSQVQFADSLSTDNGNED